MEWTLDNFQHQQIDFFPCNSLSCFFYWNSEFENGIQNKRCKICPFFEILHSWGQFKMVTRCQHSSCKGCTFSWIFYRNENFGGVPPALSASFSLASKAKKRRWFFASLYNSPSFPLVIGAWYRIIFRAIADTRIRQLYSDVGIRYPTKM